MRLTSILLLLSALLAGGCAKEPAETPIPMPPCATAETNKLETLTSITNDVSLKEIHHPEDKAQAAKLATNGVIVLPVDFTAKGKSAARATWDFKISADLRFSPGIQFNFYCEDLSQFSSFSCYFKSGKGWYSASFSTEEDGEWQPVKILKSQCEIEGVPSGWGDISTIRISGWRAGEGKTRCALCALAKIPAKTDVAVVYADSLAAAGGAESKSYMSFAGKLNGTLQAIGLEGVIVADTDLDTNILSKVSAVVLPYNPKMPDDKIALLREYAGHGGKLLGCYSLPKEIADLLGVKFAGMKRPDENGGAAIAGFLKVGGGIAGQPDFATQASWMTMLPVRTKDVKVVAEWADGKRKSLGIPALVRTKSGFFMSHVWLGGTEGAQADLMRAIMSNLSPKLGKKIAENIECAAQKREADRAWLASRTSKPGEHRAFWCHSARGLGAGHNWDSSVKFLKGCGFNTLMANFTWGGVAFYDSKVLPVAKEVSTKGDALNECLSVCRKYGVKLHAWKVCWNMGTYAEKEFVERMVSEGRTQVTAGGKKKERWLCPSHPKNRDLEIEAMVELAKKGVDGIHFDYIRYSGKDSCFCDGCRERFEIAIGRSITNWPADVRDNGAFKKEWRDFRVSNITRVVEAVARRVRKEAPGVQISAALFRNHVTDPDTVAQDWAHWCREGWLDFACNMDYVDSPAMFRSQVKMQIGAAGNVKLYPGIGLSCWPNDGNDAVRLAKQIQVVRDLGLDGFTVFNFDRRAERVLPLMRIGVTKED